VAAHFRHESGGTNGFNTIDMSSGKTQFPAQRSTYLSAVLRRKMPGHAVRESKPSLPAGRSFPVIAMAASVGGLKALSVILERLPADFPAAIAIVMHLSPDHKSILAANTPTRMRPSDSITRLAMGKEFLLNPASRLLDRSRRPPGRRLSRHPNLVLTPPKSRRPRHVQRKKA
jgi:hypothetical protein